MTAVRRVSCSFFRRSLISSKSGCAWALQTSILRTEIINYTYVYYRQGIAIFVIHRKHKSILGQRIWRDIASGIGRISPSVQFLVDCMGQYSFFCLLHSFITHVTRLITLEKIKKCMYPKVIFKLVLKGWMNDLWNMHLKYAVKTLIYNFCL